MRRLLFVLAAVFSASLFCGTGSSYAGPILFNPNGTGAAGAVSINQFEFATGNGLARGGVTAVNDFVNSNGAIQTPFEFFLQATLDNVKLNDAAMASFSGEFTVVAALTEIVTDASVTPGGVGYAAFGDAPIQTANYFEIWHNPGSVPNSLAGTGFNEGTLILSGTVGTTNDDGQNNFLRGGGDPQNLDQFPAGAGNNNYPGQQTVTGSGGSSLLLEVTTISWDPNYFPLLNAFDAFTFRTDLSLPFTGVNPSSQFLVDSTFTSVGVMPTPAGAAPGGTGSIGVVNGLDGPDFQVEIDGRGSVSGAVVPEPSSIAVFALIGGGLGASVIRRRRKA